MSPNRQTVRKLGWLALAFGVAVAVLFIASSLGLLPWNSINCWHEDVDIGTGRIRSTRYLCWIAVRTGVTNSALTDALQPPELQATNAAWRRVLTLSPGIRNSPHYSFHSAIAQIHELELLWRLADFTPAAKRASALRLLSAWQAAGDDGAAGQFLRCLGEFCQPQGGEPRRVEAEDVTGL